MIQTQPSLDDFVGILRGVRSRVEELDPAGTDRPMRLSVAFSLYSGYDSLRSEEHPLDRPVLEARLRVIEAMLARTLRREAKDPSRSENGSRGVEEVVADLYSRCWAKYDDPAFLKTVDLFEERFRLNQVELDFLKGAICLDAGCGSGRYTLAMAKMGARQSVGIDLSERAVREARERSERLGFSDRAEFHLGSVIELPRPWSGRFDFVCSNGVVHHTRDSFLGLKEIFRVLKPGGSAYLFVYGAGGLFWEIVDVVRELVAPVPMEFADLWLQGVGLPPGKIFNFMDHWYTPIQERLTRQEMEERLRRCGFVELLFLPRAKIYDASERRFRFPEERDLVGEGDLRYLVRKPR